MIIVCGMDDAACHPSATDLDAIEVARRTLGAIGLRLHDYILWHGERSLSLRAAGRL